MNRPKLIFVIALIFSAIFVGATVSFAQGDNRQRVEPSYEVSLQVIVGSNDATQRGELPANLAAISKGLRSIYENPTREAFTWLLDLPRYAGGTGYIQFFALAFYLIGLYLTPRTTRV